MTEEEHDILFLRSNEPSNRSAGSKGVMAFNRRIVLYALVSGSCTLFAVILYLVASGLSEPRIGLTVVYLTSAVMAAAAMSLMILTVVVRHKSLKREVRQGMQHEVSREVYPPEEDDYASEDNENAAILLKRNSEKSIK